MFVISITLYILAIFFTPNAEKPKRPIQDTSGVYDGSKRYARDVVEYDMFYSRYRRITYRRRAFKYYSVVTFGLGVLYLIIGWWPFD
jgi:hypothetical protein